MKIAFGRATMWAAPALAVVLALGTTASASAQYGPPPGPPPQGGGWDVPPPELRGVQQQGFHDGIEGARRDFENHRSPNVNNRDEFRHPSFHGPERRAYREAFRRGYDVGVHHLMAGGGPRPY